MKRHPVPHGPTVHDAAMAAGYATLNTASVIVALLVQSGAIEKSAAAMALEKIAAATRADVENSTGSVMGNAFARWLEEVAAAYA